jgi:hypothetical protein
MPKLSQLLKGYRRCWTIWLFGLTLAMAIGIAGFWLVTSGEKIVGSSGQGAAAGDARDDFKARDVEDKEAVGVDGRDASETAVSDSHRQPLQIREKAMMSEAMLGVLASGEQTVEERVRLLKRLRGKLFSSEEQEVALAFLAGKNVPTRMSKSSSQWLADELLTTLRSQEPPWNGLAAELGKTAFQSSTDPVIRDYIMQHLGLIWEKTGPQAEIEKSLWQAMATSDETTPGTALIALSRGYARDQNEEPQRKVLQRALTLALDPSTKLAVRVTALSIAGEGGSAEVKTLATSLTEDPNTPVILRKVAERVLR